MDGSQSPEYNSLCEKMISELVRRTSIVVFLILLSYALIGGGTFYAIVFDGAWITFVATEIPFVDSQSNTGYAINLIEQFLIISVSLISTLLLEMAVCLVSNAFLAIPEIIHFESNELAIELNSKGMNLNVQMRLRNIFMKIQDFNR